MRRRPLLLALMRDSWRMLAEQDGEVRVHEVPFDQAAGPLDAVDAMAEKLVSEDLAGSGVCLGLPSDDVYTAAIRCCDLPRRDRRTAMLYRFEEHLPIEAEAASAAFWPQAAGVSVATAVRTDRLTEIVGRLRGSGIAVTAAAPTACLAAVGLLSGMAGTAGGKIATDYLVIALDGRAEIFRIADGRMRSWNTVPPTADHVANCMRMDLLTGPVAEEVASVTFVEPGGDGSDFTGKLAGALEGDAIVVASPATDQEILGAAARTGADLASGRSRVAADLAGGLAADAWGRMARALV